MKRIMAMILSVLVAFSLMSEVLAIGDSMDATIENLRINETIDEFLHGSVRTVYFYDKDPDVLSLTIDVLSEEDAANSASKVSEQLSSMKETSGYAGRKNANISDIAYLKANIKFYNDGLKYFAHVYESENVKYLWFEEKSVVTDVKVKGHIAEVSVIQKLDYQYVDCDEPTSEIINYYFVMVKEGEQWLVAAIDTDNDFYNSYKNVPFVLELQIDEFDRARTLAKTVEEDRAGEVAIVNTDLIPDATITATDGTVSYNKNNAANYALTYSTQIDDSNNQRYPTYKNEDFRWSTAPCMLFASQCVWAGFGGSNSPADINAKHMMDTHGADKWYSTKNECTPSWWSCKEFRNYVINSRDTSDQGLYCETLYIESDQNTMKGVPNIFVPYIEDVVIKSEHNSHYSVDEPKTTPFTADDLKGAVIHGHGDKGILGHALVCNNATGINRNEIYVTAYNSCRKNKQLSLVYPVGWSNMHDLYIIVPKTFKDATTGTRLYAKLENAYSAGNTLTLTGNSSAQVSSLTIRVFKEGQTDAESSLTVQNRSIVRMPFKFTAAGIWRVEVSSPGLSTFTYRVRIV